MFLAAILGLGESASQCRLRNMTQFGAMVECDSIMPIGSTVIITRGELSVAGEIKWSNSNQFGIKFSEKIDIKKWLVEPFTTPRIARCKPLKTSMPSGSASSNTDQDSLDDKTIIGRLAEELLYVSRIVEGIGLVLITDPLLRHRHAASLQQLDVGQKMLSELAQIIPLEDKVSNISQVATGPMRARLLRANPI